MRRFVESLRGSKDCTAIKSALESWFHEVQAADWKNPSDVKRSYRKASIVGRDRIVFNIRGNSYRLVVAVDYRRQIAFIRWSGSRGACENIDVRRETYGA